MNDMFYKNSEKYPTVSDNVDVFDAKTIKVLYRSVGKAVAMNHEDGFLKLIIRENKIIDIDIKEALDMERVFDKELYNIAHYLSL